MNCRSWRADRRAGAIDELAAALVDCRNAFNELEREAMVAEVRLRDGDICTKYLGM